MNILYAAHSGLRYLVLLVALGAVIALGNGARTGRSISAARNMARLFVGLLDVQIVLGFLLVMNGLVPDAVVGHLILMVLAAAVTHGSFLIGQKANTDQRELAIRLGGIVLALVLIVLGIMAIGESVLGYSPLR